LRRFRRIASGAILGALIAYSTVGSFFATASAEQRYYGRPYLPPLSSMKRGSETELDVSSAGAAIDPTKTAVDASGAVVSGSPLGQQLEIVGWAADLAHRSAAGGVIGLIDGRDEIPASYGFATENMSKALRTFEFFWDGYHFYIPTQNMTFGSHTIELFVASKDLSAVYPAIRKVNVIVDPPRPFTIGDRVHMVGSLEHIGSLQDTAPADTDTGPVWINRMQPLLVRGWAADVRDGAPPERISITIDGKHTYDAKLGDLTPNLSAQFPSMAPSVAIYLGFTSLISLNSLPAGTHHLAVMGYMRNHGAVTLIKDFVFGVYEPRSFVNGLKPPYVDRPFSFGDPQRIHGYVEVVGSQENTTDGPHGGPVYIDHKNELFVRGWGLDLTRRAAVERLTLTIDGKDRYPMRTGGFRPDLARAQVDKLSESVNAYAGFSILVALHSYAPGVHHFDISTVDRTGRVVKLILAFPIGVF